VVPHKYQHIWELQELYGIYYNTNNCSGFDQTQKIGFFNYKERVICVYMYVYMCIYKKGRTN